MRSVLYLTMAGEDESSEDRLMHVERTEVLRFFSVRPRVLRRRISKFTLRFPAEVLTLNVVSTDN